MDNIQQVRKALGNLYQDLLANKVVSGHAKELSNAAGKMISSANVELQYHALNKDNREIPFLEYAEKGKRKVGSRA